MDKKTTIEQEWQLLWRERWSYDEQIFYDLAEVDVEETRKRHGNGEAKSLKVNQKKLIKKLQDLGCDLAYISYLHMRAKSELIQPSKLMLALDLKKVEEIKKREGKVTRGIRDFKQIIKEAAEGIDDSYGPIGADFIKFGNEMKTYLELWEIRLKTPIRNQGFDSFYRAVARGDKPLSVLKRYIDSMKQLRNLKLVPPVPSVDELKKLTKRNAHRPAEIETIFMRHLRDHLRSKKIRGIYGLIADFLNVFIPFNYENGRLAEEREPLTGDDVSNRLRNV